jgi:hypothetical protein
MLEVWKNMNEDESLESAWFMITVSLVNADIESLHRIPSKRAVVKTTDKGNLSI